MPRVAREDPAVKAALEGETVPADQLGRQDQPGLDLQLDQWRLVRLTDLVVLLHPVTPKRKLSRIPNKKTGRDYSLTHFAHHFDFRPSYAKSQLKGGLLC